MFVELVYESFGCGSFVFVVEIVIGVFENDEFGDYFFFLEGGMNVLVGGEWDEFVGSVVYEECWWIVFGDVEDWRDVVG